MKAIILIIYFLIHVCYGMNIPCVEYNKNCYYQPCCEPYTCYEETVCIEKSNFTKI